VWVAWPWRNIFACLQPTVDCQRLRCSEEAQDEIMFWAVLLEILNTGSGPINSDAAACLASLSAISLPGTLLLFHFTWIMSLHYFVKLEMLIEDILSSSYYRKHPEFISPQLWSPNSPDFNPVDNNVWEILQEKVYKTGITDLELSTTPLMNDCRSNDMIQFAHSVLSRCFSLFRSVMHILYIFSCNSPTR